MLPIMKRTPQADLRVELFGSVFLLGQHLTRLVDEALRPLDLTTRQWLLLAVLTKKFPGEDATLTAAASWYGTSRQNVKKIAEQLEQRGYLLLVPDPDDGRVVRLKLTAKVAVFDGHVGHQRQVALFDQVFGGLRPSDVEQLHALIQRWTRHLSPDP
jgi:DNA-binding MarR family transcriptional regulator